MMAQITQLNENLANQIAAGEVIERPASVVKELVENSIDAAATRISIELNQAGKKLIRVKDNGKGIASSQVPIAFLRHATSKIKTKQDLFNVATLGFRGEALPSIASVAAVMMMTKTKAEQLGVCLQIKGGKTVEQKPQVTTNGTTVEVSDLFYNTPARKKYLATDKTELAACIDCVNRIALSHPQIAFELRHNDKQLLKTAGNGKLNQTFAAIYGIKVAQKMLSFETKLDEMNISGLVSLPELTRANKNYLSIFVNHRFVKSRPLSQAVLHGYGSKLMVGRYPLGVLNVNVDPLLVDVNVHPTKQTVRFVDEAKLCQTISQAIYQRLGQETLIPKAADNLANHPQIAKSQAVIQPKISAANAVSDWVNETKNTTLPTDAASAPVKPATSYEQSITPKPLAEAVMQSKASYRTDNPQVVDTITPSPKHRPIVITDKNQLQSPVVAKFKLRNKPQQASNELDQTHASKKNPQFPELRYLAQLHGSYLLAESEDGFYIIDQHAAQERCNYERFLPLFATGQMQQQTLLVPLVVDLPTQDFVVVEQHLADLAKIGVHLKQFGKNSVILHSHPLWFAAGQEEQTLKTLLGWLTSNQTITLAKLQHDACVMASCKQAIKANYHLDDRSAKHLLAQLAYCKNPFNCPHGRPVLVSFDNNDLLRMFKRIQDSHQSIKNAFFGK